MLVEQAQLTEGEGGKDGYGSGEFQDNDTVWDTSCVAGRVVGQAGQLLG